MSNTFRGLVVLAVVVVSSLVWVVHTQEVLTTPETVFASVVDAETAVRGSVTATDARALEPLDRAERTINGNLDRLAALTADNPNHQARVTQLRQHTTRLLAALRALAQARQAVRVISPADPETQQTSMDAARRTIQALRTAENRLLVSRTQADRFAVNRLQWVSIIRSTAIATERAR